MQRGLQPGAFPCGGTPTPYANCTTASSSDSAKTRPRRGVACQQGKRLARPLLSHTVRKRFRTACRALGLDRLRTLTIHHGRHTFIRQRSPAVERLQRFATRLSMPTWGIYFCSGDFGQVRRRFPLTMERALAADRTQDQDSEDNRKACRVVSKEPARDDRLPDSRPIKPIHRHSVRPDCGVGCQRESPASPLLLSGRLAQPASYFIPAS